MIGFLAALAKGLLVLQHMRVFIGLNFGLDISIRSRM